MTEDEAAAAVIAYLETDSGGAWKAAVTRVEDTGPAWRVFYNSQAYLDSGSVSDALAGNWPYLVSKATGEIKDDADYRAAKLGRSDPAPPPTSRSEQP